MWFLQLPAFTFSTAPATVDGSGAAKTNILVHRIATRSVCKSSITHSLVLSRDARPSRIERFFAGQDFACLTWPPRTLY